MKKYGLIGLVALVVAMAAPGAGFIGGVRPALAATAEELQAQNLRDFEKWRRDIPDYERRLYERVKAVNSRLIQRTNLILIAIAILALTVIVWSRRVPSGAGGTGGGSAATEVRDAMRALHRNQEMLAEMIDHLDKRLAEHVAAGEGDVGELAEAVGESRRVLDEIRQNIAAVAGTPGQ